MQSRWYAAGSCQRLATGCRAAAAAAHTDCKRMMLAGLQQAQHTCRRSQWESMSDAEAAPEDLRRMSSTKPKLACSSAVTRQVCCSQAQKLTQHQLQAGIYLQLPQP